MTSIGLLLCLHLSKWVNIALRRFLHIETISRQKEARSRDYVLLLFRMTSRIRYSAQYHRQHCTLHAFEQFGALYMPNHDPWSETLAQYQPNIVPTPRVCWNWLKQENT